MARWTSYEPAPGGKGYTLYDDKDKPTLFAPAPSLDALLPSLTPRADYLANAGQGGQGGTSGADPSQQPAGPPAQVADVAPSYSSQPEPVSREPPPAAPEPPAPRPRARVAAAGGEQPAAQGEQVSQAESDLRMIENLRIQRAMAAGGPARKIGAHWQDKQRQVEGKMIDPAAMAEWEQAQAEERAMRATMADSKAEAEANAEAERRKGLEKENEIAARKDATARKYQEDQYKLEGQIEAERKALANPNDWWEGQSTGQQIAASIALALGNAADALRGGAGDAASKTLNAAIERHAQSRVRNVQMLDQQRGRNKESHELTQARLEAERVQAAKAVDDKIKGILADGANPVVRELVMEDVPPSKSLKASAVALVRLMRRAIPGANEDPRDIQKSADEYLAKLTPQEKRLVFEEGPNGELVPKQNVRYLASEYEQARARLDTARERLGLADKLAVTQRQTSEFQPEKIVGGGGPDLKTVEAILKDRVARGDKRAEADLKRLEVTGKLDERAETRAEKEGARTFVLNGQEYAARPGTSPEAVRSFQDKASLLSSAQKAAKEIKDTNWAANKAGSKDLDVNVRSLAAAANTLYGQGAMTTDDLNWFTSTLKNTNWTTADGKAAAGKIVQRLEDIQRGWVQQVGAKPRGSR